MIPQSDELVSMVMGHMAINLHAMLFSLSFISKTFLSEIKPYTSEYAMAQWPRQNADKSVHTGSPKANIYAYTGCSSGCPGIHEAGGMQDGRAWGTV